MTQKSTSVFTALDYISIVKKKTSLNGEKLIAFQYLWLDFEKKDVILAKLKTSRLSYELTDWKLDIQLAPNVEIWTKMKSRLESLFHFPQHKHLSDPIF